MSERSLTVDVATYLSMKRLRQKGLTYEAIAERHGVAPSFVRLVLKPVTVTPQEGKG